MSFIMESTILPSTIEWGINDLVYKLSSDKLTHEMMRGSTNFTALFQNDACIVFSLASKKSIT